MEKIHRAIDILNQMYGDWRTEEEKEALEIAIKALETVERIEARRRELEKKLHSSFSLTEANEHYALTKLLREAENADSD